MPFDTVLGQESAKRLFRRMLRSNRVPHAILLTGPAGVGEAALALAFARAANCLAGGEEPCDACPSCHRIQALTHPDVHLLFPARKSRREGEDVDPEEERKYLSALAADPYRIPMGGPAETILIDRIRRLETDLSRGRFEGRRRVAILLEAERMRQETANALLKTLEEPLPDTVLILVSSRPDLLLATIHSRCQRIRLRPLTREEVRRGLEGRTAIAEPRARLLAGLSQGSLRRALDLVDRDVEELRDQAYRFLREGAFGSDTALVPMIEKWSAGSGDRVALEALFEMISLWLRDALLSGAGCPDRIVQEDRREEVAFLAGALGLEAIREALEEIDRCRDMSRRNVNVSLILIAFWRRIRGMKPAA
jgi:DNA polymerase-3 subunit delta'